MSYVTIPHFISEYLTIETRLILNFNVFSYIFETFLFYCPLRKRNEKAITAMLLKHIETNDN